MSLTSQANAKSEAVVGVSSTEIHQGPVLDASSGRLLGEAADPGPELRAAHLEVNRAGWSEMNRLAQDLGVSVQSLMAEACNDALLKYQRPPVVEADEPARRASSMPTLTLHAFAVPLAWPALMGAWYWHQVVVLPMLALWAGTKHPAVTMRL
jgi:hypothetical protein